MDLHSHIRDRYEPARSLSEQASGTVLQHHLRLQRNDDPDVYEADDDEVKRETELLKRLTMKERRWTKRRRDLVYIAATTQVVIEIKQVLAKPKPSL